MSAPGTSTAAARKLLRRQRVVRVVAIVVGLAFGGFAIAAMASKNPKQAASGIQQVLPGPSEGGGGSNTSVAPAPTAGGATSDTIAGGGSSAGTGSDFGSGAGSTPGGGGSTSGGATGSTTGGSSGGGGGGGGSSTPTTARKVAVVTPLLSTSSFATSTGVPVLCGLMASATGPFVSKPQLAAIASAITSSCNQFGNEGTTALDGLNQQLGALAAINPAIDPLLEQLSTIFETAGSSQNLPFTANILYLVQLIAFFHG